MQHSWSCFDYCIVLKSPEELVPGVWALYDQTEQYCYGAVFGGRHVLLIGPGEPHPLMQFAEAKRATIPEVIDLSAREGGSPPAHPEGVSLSVPGWALMALLGTGGAAVHNAEQRILFCGDLLSDERIPSLPHGSHEYLDCLDALEKLEPKLLIPARGTPAQGKREVRERIERDRAYIAALRRHVETSHRAGISLDRAQQVARSVYEDYPFVEQHVENVGFVWDE
jgi:hypothetical protein